MTRKRFIKLCMGTLGYSRDGANAAAKAAQKSSYEVTYNLLRKTNDRYIKGLSNAMRRITESLVPVTKAFAEFAKAINAGAKAFEETMRNHRESPNFWEEYSND